jgi:pteridine reductase
MVTSTESKVILVTGAARRIGKAIVELLHQQGMRVVIHYHHSQAEAAQLCQRFNQRIPHSALALPADLTRMEDLERMVQQATAEWGYLDGLVNNASVFFQTSVQTTSEDQWANLFDANLKAPFFLSQLAVPWLKKRQGSIVNITDIHAEKPMKSYTVYCLTKAGLSMMTRQLAKELAPEIKVNAVAPGSIIWPEKDNELTDPIKTDILSRIALQRSGEPADIAKAVSFFLTTADYITGQELAVDGGRLLNC